MHTLMAITNTERLLRLCSSRILLCVCFTLNCTLFGLYSELYALNRVLGTAFHSELCYTRNRVPNSEVFRWPSEWHPNGNADELQRRDYNGEPIAIDKKVVFLSLRHKYYLEQTGIFIL